MLVRSSLSRFVSRTPALVRGVFAAFALLVVGGAPPGVALVLSLRLRAETPWFLLVTVAWIGLFWWWARGGGPPRHLGEARRANARDGPLAVRPWLGSLLAGGLGVAGAMSLALLTARLAKTSQGQLDAAFDLALLAPATAIAAIAAIAMTAGVVEEIAFRGYMLSVVQRRHGWTVGILATGLAFFAAHLDHGYASLAYLPMFLAYSVVHGLLVRATGSIRPSIVLHAVGDFLMLPLQYGIVGADWHLPAGTCAAFAVGFFAASALAFRATGLHRAASDLGQRAVDGTRGETIKPSTLPDERV